MRFLPSKFFKFICSDVEQKEEENFQFEFLRVFNFSYLNKNDSKIIQISFFFYNESFIMCDPILSIRESEKEQESQFFLLFHFFDR